MTGDPQITVNANKSVHRPVSLENTLRGVDRLDMSLQC